MMIKLFHSLLILILWTACAMAEGDPETMQVGHLNVLVIPDAEGIANPDIIPGIADHPDYKGLYTGAPIPSVCRTYLTNVGERRILFDAGWGSEQKTVGHTLALLQKSGISPESVTDIALTHLDFDHIGGLVKNGKKVFPNATLWVSRPEAEAWRKGNVVKRGPEAIALAQEVLRLYGDKLRTFEFGEEILPNVRTVDASGHTPGHTAYDITSNGDKLTIAGDIMHLAQVQLPLPQLNSIYDMDEAKAAQSREKLLSRAVQDKAIFAGMHMPMLSPVLERPDGGFAMRQPR